MAYLTTNNAKIEKGLERGYLTFGIHFAPANLSKYNTCANASEGCRESCLNLSGMGVFPQVQTSRIEKTNLFLGNIKEELEKIKKEVEKAIKKAIRNNLTPCFRFNLTSDLQWEKLKLENGNNLFQEFPNVQFYDYTKNFHRMFLNIPNYHLTFSRSESVLNQLQAENLMKLGKNVAIVFSTKKGKELPESYNGKKVIDGDKDDLRFLDSKNCIVGLRAKGKAKKDKSGFVIHV